MKIFRELEERKQEMVTEVKDFFEPMTEIALPFAYAVGRKTLRGIRKLKNLVRPKRQQIAEEDEGFKGPIPVEVYDCMEDMIIEVELRIEDEEKEGLLVHYDFQVDRIECSDLKNVELMGENDPYVIVTYRGEQQTTEALDGAGESAVWDDLNYVFPTSNQLIDSESLDLQVFDQNDMRADTYIGSASFSLASCETMLGRTMELDAVIYDKKKKKVGKVVIFCVLDMKGASAEKAEERLRNQVSPPPPCNTIEKIHFVTFFKVICNNHIFCYIASTRENCILSTFLKSDPISSL